MRSKHDNLSVKHWETRPEKNWEKFSFNQPYKKGLERLQEQVLDKTNFDPAGEDTCFFELRHGDPRESRKWGEYTKTIENKALEIAKKKSE